MLYVLFGYLALLFLGSPDLTSGSTPAPFRQKTVEEHLNDLYGAIAKVERRDRSELAQKIKNSIKDELKEKIKKEIKDELKEMIKKEIKDELQEMIKKEIKDELKDWAAKQKEQMLAEVREAVEVLKVRINETEELARSCLASQRHTEEAVRKNLSLSSAEVLKTLTDHTSEISSIDTRLSRVENRCSGPPHVENGHPMDSGLEGRDHEDVVTYACRGDKVPAGNDKMLCLYGKWTGELPRCVDHHAQCGLDSRNVSGNSSSGAPSRPWMAAVYRKGGSLLECAGSIVQRSYILTSVGCVHDYDKEYGWKRLDATDLTVRLGSTDTGDVAHHLQDHNVRTIHVHPLYNTSEHWEYDIALLELEKPIDYDLFVGPVCLPPRETPEYNGFYEPQSSVHVIGWIYRGYSYTLREYPAVIQSPDICKRKFLELFGRNLSDRVFCAAPSGPDVCRTTRGGWTAVQSRPDGRGGIVWTQVGVGHDHMRCLVDGSSSRGIRTYSFLFSRLQQLVPWVEETVGGAAP